MNERNYRSEVRRMSSPFHNSSVLHSAIDYSKSSKYLNIDEDFTYGEPIHKHKHLSLILENSKVPIRFSKIDGSDSPSEILQSKVEVPSAVPTSSWLSISKFLAVYIVLQKIVTKLIYFFSLPLTYVKEAFQNFLVMYFWWMGGIILTSFEFIEIVIKLLTKVVMTLLRRSWVLAAIVAIIGAVFGVLSYLYHINQQEKKKEKPTKTVAQRKKAPKKSWFQKNMDDLITTLLMFCFLVWLNNKTILAFLDMLLLQFI